MSRDFFQKNSDLATNRIPEGKTIRKKWPIHLGQPSFKSPQVMQIKRSHSQGLDAASGVSVSPSRSAVTPTAKSPKALTLAGRIHPGHRNNKPFHRQTRLADKHLLPPPRGDCQARSIPCHLERTTPPPKPSSLLLTLTGNVHSRATSTSLAQPAKSKKKQIGTIGTLFMEIIEVPHVFE